MAAARMRCPRQLLRNRRPSALLLVVGVAVTLLSPAALSLTGRGNAQVSRIARRSSHDAPSLVPAPPRSRQVGSLSAIHYGPESFQLLDLHLPEAEVYPDPRPVIVYLHSGGWVAGDRSAIPSVALSQVTRGYALASVDYRLATLTPDGQPVASFPGSIWDVKRAIRYLKANALTWNLDPRHVILMGASAGGYLAAFAGATAGRFEPPDLSAAVTVRTDSSVRGIVDLVGPTDLETFEHTDHPWAAPLTADFLGCPPPSTSNLLTCPDSILREASVSPYVDNTDPPIFLAYGALDTLVVPATQGQPLAQAWIHAHHDDTASASYDVVPDGHNVQIMDGSTVLDTFFDRIANT